MPVTNMVINNGQQRERIVQILCAFQLQPRGSVSQKLGVIRQDVARFVGRVLFKHIANCSFVERLPCVQGEECKPPANYHF
jgi:hypothetical protein